jgi:hypothetical protein
MENAQSLENQSLKYVLKTEKQALRIKSRTSMLPPRAAEHKEPKCHEAKRYTTEV